MLAADETHACNRRGASCTDGDHGDHGLNDPKHTPTVRRPSDTHFCNRSFPTKTWVMSPVKIIRAPPYTNLYTAGSMVA